MYKINKFQSLPGSMAEIEIEIESVLLEKYWPEAIKHLNEHVSLPGFRKGHIPEKTLVSHLGEISILEEAAEHAIEKVYPEIIEEKKLSPIGSPKVVITKIARGNPLGVTIRVALVPEVKIPDYKAISKKVMSKKEAVEVEDKEVDEVIKEIKEYRTKTDPNSKKESAENDKGEITDEFVKTLGDFKDVADFKAKVRENISKEKEYKLKEKKRIETIEAIREKSEIEVPDVLIESETERMVHEFSHELTRIGGSFEKYLAEIKKTEDDLKKEWKEKATNRVKNELILFEIAKLEKISPKVEDVEKEAKYMQEHYPNSPKERIVPFVEELLTKEEVFKFFEEQK